MSDFEGQTLTNAALGAIVTTVFYSLGPLATIAPVFGGFVAGYLQHQAGSGGMKAGGLKGLIMVIPAIGFGIIAGGLLAGVPVIGELLTGSVFLIVAIIVAHSVAVGVVGGLLGGILSGGPSQQTEVDPGRGRAGG